MNNTNQQLYAIYNNIQRLYDYRQLISLDDVMPQDQFIKAMQKDKYILLSSIGREYVTNDQGEIDSTKLNKMKELITSYNEKTRVENIKITNILLVYTGTDCESKRANMMNLINHIRFPNADVLIITPTKISSGVAKGLHLLSGQHEHRGHTFKAFTYNLLSSVLPEHELVPQYTILTSDQVNDLKKWFIDPEALPKVFENDPQMVWIGANAGDVIKYKYLSEVTIEAIGYCKVIPSN